MPSSAGSEPTLEELSAYIDSELDTTTQARVGQHVADCQGCQERLDGLRRTAYAIRALPMESPPRSFTVAQARRPGWRLIPVGWAASAAVAALVLGIGISQLHPGGSATNASTASGGGASSYGAAQAPAAAPASSAAARAALTQADKSVAGSNRVTVVDPRDSGRQLGVATDQAAYPPSATLVVNGLTIGGNSGEITIMLRRGSYGVRLSPPTTTRSSSGIAFNGSYRLSDLPLVDPRSGSYLLTVTWTDSSGASLIAELPVSITS